MNAIFTRSNFEMLMLASSNPKFSLFQKCHLSYSTALILAHDLSVKTGGETPTLSSMVPVSLI